MSQGSFVIHKMPSSEAFLAVICTSCLCSSHRVFVLQKYILLMLEDQAYDIETRRSVKDRELCPLNLIEALLKGLLIAHRYLLTLSSFGPFHPLTILSAFYYRFARLSVYLRSKLGHDAIHLSMTRVTLISCFVPGEVFSPLVTRIECRLHYKSFREHSPLQKI